MTQSIYSFITTQEKTLKRHSRDKKSLIFWYLLERNTAFTLVLHCLLILRLLGVQWGCVLVLRLED